MNLGELIEALEKVQDKEKYVYIEPYGLKPTIFDSYRGYYEELALGYSSHAPNMTVKELLENAKSCINTEFYGYKGGEYLMHEKTPVWVSNQGEVTYRKLDMVRDNSYCVELYTQGDY